MTTPPLTCSIDLPAVTPTPTQNQTPPQALANPIPGGLASAISIFSLHSFEAYPMGALDRRRIRPPKASRPCCSVPPHTAVKYIKSTDENTLEKKCSRQTARYSGHYDPCGNGHPFTRRVNPFICHFVVCLRANRGAQLHGRPKHAPPAFSCC